MGPPWRMSHQHVAPTGLLNRHAFGEIPGLVNIQILRDSGVIGQQLQRNVGNERRQQRYGLRNIKNFFGEFRKFRLGNCESTVGRFTGRIAGERIDRPGETPGWGADRQRGTSGILGAMRRLCNQGGWRKVASRAPRVPRVRTYCWASHLAIFCWAGAETRTISKSPSRS